jgi:hypothetical protein
MAAKKTAKPSKKDAARELAETLYFALSRVEFDKLRDMLADEVTDTRLTRALRDIALDEDEDDA